MYAHPNEYDVFFLCYFSFIDSKISWCVLARTHVNMNVLKNEIKNVQFDLAIEVISLGFCLLFLLLGLLLSLRVLFVDFISFSL